MSEAWKHVGYNLADIIRLEKTVFGKREADSIQMDTEGDGK
jgi:hypothetical protein